MPCVAQPAPINAVMETKATLDSVNAMRWVCVRHGYAECSRCERPPLWEKATQTEARASCSAVDGRRKTAEEVGRAALINLEGHRERLCARAQALEVQIGALISGDSGPVRGRARRIWMRLGGDYKPSLRTVQWHLRRIAQSGQHCAYEASGVTRETGPARNLEP